MSFFIMAGTYASINTADQASIDTLTRSDPRGPRWTSQVNRIASRIKDFYPDAKVETFTYTRQVSSENREQGGWGKAAVSLIN